MCKQPDILNHKMWFADWHKTHSTYKHTFGQTEHHNLLILVLLITDSVWLQQNVTVYCRLQTEETSYHYRYTSTQSCLLIWTPVSTVLFMGWATNNFGINANGQILIDIIQQMVPLPLFIMRWFNLFQGRIHEVDVFRQSCKGVFSEIYHFFNQYSFTKRNQHFQILGVFHMEIPRLPLSQRFFKCLAGQCN